jgi:hypothetical protein
MPSLGGQADSVDVGHARTTSKRTDQLLLLKALSAGQFTFSDQPANLVDDTVAFGHRRWR